MVQNVPFPPGSVLFVSFKKGAEQVFVLGCQQPPGPWTAVSQNGVLTLHFDWDDESAIDIYLKSPVLSALVNQFSVGNYTPANLPNGKAGATFVYRENGIVKTFANPSSGNLTITQYDAAKSTISGSFGQIKYSGIGTETQGNTYLSGIFENLPLEVK